MPPVLPIWTVTPGVVMQVPAVAGAGVLQAVAVKVAGALTVTLIDCVVTPDVPGPVHDQLTG